MSSRGLLITLGALLVLVAVVDAGRAQNRPDTTATDTTVAADTTDRASPEQNSTTPSSNSDTSDTDDASFTAEETSSSGASKGGASEEAVTFSARDSMVIRSSPSGNDQGTLYGNANMSYQNASLKARTIDMNFQSGTLRAKGSPSDSTRGSRALFKRKSTGDGGMSGLTSGSDESGDDESNSQSFTGNVLSYNLNTKRGRVAAARTGQQEGYVEGSAVKVFEDSTLFVRDGVYTTCNCPPGKTPSYSLHSDQMKLKEAWVYTGPIQLYLFNVPTPLWLPFGFLPNTEGRRSGPLSPEYGQDNRGFFLKDWGWYFALNDFTDLTLRASIWSQGSFEVRPRFRYNKRYNYNGDLQLTYRRERIGEEEDPNFQDSREGEIRWNHNQTLSPTASLTGKVDLATSGDFSRRNSDSFDDAVRQEATSSIRYNKRWPNGGRRLNISARQRQNFQSGVVNLTLPNLNFSQSDFKPFQGEQQVGEERWFEKITTQYDLNVKNDYNFEPRDLENLRRGGTPADSARADSIERADISWYEALVDRDKYELATGNDDPYDVQATHEIPLDATFRVERYNLSLTPSITYTSDWRLSTVRKTARRDSTGGVAEIVEDTKPGFYARHDFGTSLSANSQVFGTFPIGIGPFEGLRHRLSPNLSMNYQPNFNDPFWGRTRPVRFADGTPVIQDSATGEVRRYDILNGRRANQSTQQWELRFSLSNVFETKRIQRDTTESQSEEKLTLLNLDISGLRYNFAADSFRVGDRINVRARTSIDPFDVSANWTFSPYALRRAGSDSRQNVRQIDRLMVAESPFTPIRLTQFDGRVGINLSSETSVSSSPNSSSSKQSQSSGGLSPFNIPWSFDLTFNYRLQRPRKEITSRDVTLDGTLKLNVTPLWYVKARSGYDFRQDELSTTRIAVQRDLGCWDMSFNWVPFGEFQQYGFRLQVSSGHLSDLLKLQVPNQGGEGRLGGVQNTAGTSF